MSADPVETDPINIYERWASEDDDVEVFEDPAAATSNSKTSFEPRDVAQYEIASIEQLS